MVTTLVTGGTGFIGSEIVRRLRSGMESVRVLSRDPVLTPLSRRSPGVEYRRGDIFNSKQLGEAMQGCDALIIATQFDNAPFESPSRGLTYERIDGEGTERQVEAAKQAGVKRIIYLSGAGTREGREEPWFRAKARAERAVRESTLAWTILRPSWVYGPEDRSLNRFALFARVSPIVPLIGMGHEKIEPVYVRDVAEAVYRILNRSDTHGKTYEIGGPELLTMNQIVKTLLKVMGRHRLILPQPKWMMKCIAAVVQTFPEPLRLLTPGGVDFVTMEERVDATELVETLGIRRTPLTEGLGNYLRSSASSKAFGTIARAA